MLLRKLKSVLSTPLIENLYRLSRSRQAGQLILKCNGFGRTSHELEHDSRSSSLLPIVCSPGARQIVPRHNSVRL
jgi:hypothetical protein